MSFRPVELGIGEIDFVYWNNQEAHHPLEIISTEVLENKDKLARTEGVFPR